jgi:hypothetical protein
MVYLIMLSVAMTTALGGLVVSVLATGPTGYSVVGSNSTKDGGFLWVIKIPSPHFLQRGSKAVGPMSQSVAMTIQHQIKG